MSAASASGQVVRKTLEGGRREPTGADGRNAAETAAVVLHIAHFAVHHGHWHASPFVRVGQGVGAASRRVCLNTVAHFPVVCQEGVPKFLKVHEGSECPPDWFSIAQFSRARHHLISGGLPVWMAKVALQRWPATG